MTSPYKTTALRYWSHGWQGPLPVGTQPHQKTAPPAGYTGNDGVWPTEEQIVEWVAVRPDVNIALRLPANVVGIDVDDYDDKPGATTMIAATKAHGKLPRTWVSTSRDGQSGIRWFQLAQPQTLPGKLVHPDDDTISGVEIIQHTHRYAVVPPSIHPNGNPYRWITPAGTTITDGTLPTSKELPNLPDAWVDHIKQDCSCWAPFNYQAYTQQTNDPVQAAYTKWRARMTETYGRHDAATGGVMALVAFRERGWPGADHYLEQLHSDFTTSLGDSRNPAEAEREWERMVDGATKKAVTTSIPVWQPHHTTGQLPSPETFDARVEAELDQLRVRDTARRRFHQENTPRVELPEILTLRERLKRPHPPIEWRIDGWQPRDTRILLAAQYKAGKTTLTGNLARCLVDGDPWLGRAQVTPVTTGQVVILDFEMSERQIDGWLTDQQIRNDDQVTVIPLRGKAGTFDILDDQTRREWAARLTNCEYIILDCLRPILDALSLDEHREAGRFLTAFDALCDLAGIQDGLVVHHMGHTGERSRGDSRLRDWPDVEWRLVRANEDPDSTRFISAFGRDVEQSEGQLMYDPATRHLSYVGGDRKDAEARSVLPDVVDVLLESDHPLSERAIKDILRGRTDYSKALVERAIKVGQKDRVLHLMPGPRNSHLNHHMSQCPSVPECPGSVPGTVGVSVPVSIGTGTHTQTPETLLKAQLGAEHIDDLETPY